MNSSVVSSMFPYLVHDVGVGNSLIVFTPKSGKEYLSGITLGKTDNTNQAKVFIIL